jgi:hypothetical protein
MEHETPAEQIARFSDRANRSRVQAAKYAGAAVLFAGGELSVVPGHEVKSVALKAVSNLLLAICAGGMTALAVSSGLESAQTGREAAALMAQDTH